MPLMSLAACKAIGDGRVVISECFFNHPPGPITFEYALRQLVTNKHNGAWKLSRRKILWIRPRQSHAWSTFQETARMVSKSFFIPNQI